MTCAMLSLDARGPDLDGPLPKKVFWVFSPTACERAALCLVCLRIGLRPQGSLRSRTGQKALRVLERFKQILIRGQSSLFSRLKATARKGSGLGNNPLKSVRG